MSLRKIITFALLCGLFTSASANVGIFIHSGLFKGINEDDLFDKDGMMQLINLGQDGLLGPVIEGAWVSGDDVLIDLPFGSSEFSSSGAFDTGEMDTGVDGELSRFFDFPLLSGVLEEGDAIALRWWPQYTAAEFHAATSLLPQVGDSYGQATLAVATADPVNNTGWFVPAESTPLVIFDPLISDEAATLYGLDPTPGFTGTADLEVAPIPEPAHMAFLIGALSFLSIFIQRRSRNE